MLANSRVSAVLPVVDLGRARKFYEQKLGLQAVERADGVMFKCGQGTQLALYQRPTPTKADHTVAGWEVDNIEEVVQALGDRGVVFEQYDLPGLKTNAQGIAMVGTVKGAWFKDPDGNILGLVQFG
jgi:catechol 2,3-dioxygenase-like lactoylglutathione lyase family enzyme